MIKETTYHTDWQINRIKFILSKYSKEFFKGKKILELGAHNGYVGSYFAYLGAEVHCVEGRQENVDRIKSDYPNITIECFNLDTPEWKWGNWDIIINFGLYYHLENYHKEHLINCINNCNLMFFESLVFDSFESILYYKEHYGIDQSLTGNNGVPTTKYIEDIFNTSKQNIKFNKYTNSELNSLPHIYDWEDKNSKEFSMWTRRFWIIQKHA